METKLSQELTVLCDADVCSQDDVYTLPQYLQLSHQDTVV